MKPKTYASSADSIHPSKPRAPLFSALALIGFALLTAAPLLLIFPEKELSQKVTHATLGDPVTVSYLTNLLRTDPDNLELRVLLAEHKLYLGKLEDVPLLLEPVLKNTSSAWHIKAQLAELNYLGQLAELKHADPLAKTRILALRTGKLRALLIQPLSQENREYLAVQALNANHADWAADLYRAIIASQPLLTLDWYVSVAERMMAFSQYQLASEFYFKARHRALSRNDQKRFFYLGIGALMSNSLFDQAMQAADQNLGGLANDNEVLYFLAKTALAANDTVRAERYAKRMLHLSWLEQFLLQLAELNPRIINTANAADLRDEVPMVSGMIRFNAEHYDLAYRVFLANRNLSDAYRVAEAAVQQVADDVVWHQRLAEVSEWLGKPEIALREWRWLLEQTHTQASLLAILRLAPGMQENDILLDAWMILASKQALDKTQIIHLADLFERTARVQEGITFFKQQYAATFAETWLEQTAYLAERSGDEKTAQTSYEQLLEQHGFRPEMLFRLITFEMKQGRSQNALALLQKYRAKIAPSDKVYWKLLADLSWRLQQDDEAKGAYQQLAANKNLALEDISRYIYLLGDGQREQVAPLAELGYTQFAEPDMLLYALETYAALHDQKSQQRLFDDAINNPKVDLKNNARFFLLRAQHLYESGAFKQAKLDFLHAAKIAPNDKNILNAFFWFLIDTRDQSGIRDMITLLKAKGANHDPAYWAAFAAGYQTLEQPKLALNYFSAQLKNQPQDFLWLTNYADALEQAGQNALAERIRRHAWQGLRLRHPNLIVSLPMSADLQAVVKLAIISRPHDPALQLMQTLLRQDRQFAQNSTEQEIVRQTLLAWALSQQQYSNAKAWLWLRYTRRLNVDKTLFSRELTETAEPLTLNLSDELVASPSETSWVLAPTYMLGTHDELQLRMDSELITPRLNQASAEKPQKSPAAPVWASSLLALAENDSEQINNLLQQDSNNIPAKNRADGLIAVDSTANAQDVIFDHLTLNPDDEEWQARLLSSSLATGSSLETTLHRQQISGWQGLQAGMVLESPISQAARVAVLLSASRQINSDPLLQIPPREHVAGLQIKTASFLGYSELQWQQRQELAHTNAWLLNHRWLAAARIQMQAHLAIHADTTDSLALRSLGMQNKFSADLNYRLGKREYLSFQPSVSNYFTQQNLYLGSGKQFAWEIGYRLRTDYPDWQISLHGSQQTINSRPAGIGLLPVSSQLYSLCSNLGSSVQSQYSTAWLPYLNSCMTRNPASGLGYNADLGWVGSVLGHDQAKVSFGQGMSAALSNLGLTREIALHYRYYFDHH